MLTPNERKEAQQEHQELIKKLPENGKRVSFETSIKPGAVALTKTEQMYRH